MKGAREGGRGGGGSMLLGVLVPAWSLDNAAVIAIRYVTHHAEQNFAGCGGARANSQCHLNISQASVRVSNCEGIIKINVGNYPIIQDCVLAATFHVQIHASHEAAATTTAATTILTTATTTAVHSPPLLAGRQ